MLQYKIKYILNVFLLVFLFLLSSLSSLKADEVIKEINIIGNQRVDSETVRAIISISEGGSFNSETIELTLSELYNTGFFKNVSITENNGVFEINLDENATINKIAFEGNKRFSDEILSEIIEIREREVFSRQVVSNATDKIKELYKSEGRYGAKVNPRYVKLNDNRVNLVFEISDGPLYTVKSISFIGNNVFSDRTLKNIISTKQSAWWRFITSSDNYNEERLKIDASLLREFYFTRGYIKFQILRKQGDLLPDGSGFSVVFVINEGERHRVSSIQLKTSFSNLSVDDLRDDIPINDGDWYNVKRLEKGIKNINKKISSFGFAFSQINPNFQINEVEKSIDIILNIDEGNKNYIELIEITGNIRTLDRVIRREIELVEGDPFNSLKIQQSERNIRNLGFFKKVSVKTLPGSKENQAILNIDVEEQATGDISLGLAYSTFDELSTTFGISEKNFLGKGQRAKFGFSLSDNRRNFSLGLTQPYFLDRNLIGSFDLFNDSYTNSESNQRVNSYGFSAGAGFTSANNFYHKYTYSLQSVETMTLDDSNVKIDSDGGKVLSSLGYSFSKDNRDNRFNPTSGYYYKLSEEFAGIGGDVNYLRSILSGSYHYKYDYTDIVLGAKAEIGNIEGLDQNVSKSSRFFIGGRKIRGFESSGIGPREGNSSSSSAVGGNNYYSGRFSMRSGIGMPRETGIKWTLFSDYGSLWGVDDTASNYDVTTDTKSLRLTFGYGFLWETPIGPLSFTWADALKKESFDQLRKFEFRIGSSF